MPLLDSLVIILICRSALRVAKNPLITPKREDCDLPVLLTIRVWQKPKQREIIRANSGHTYVEHLLAGFYERIILKGILRLIDISPMGCRTGFLYERYRLTRRSIK